MSLLTLYLITTILPNLSLLMQGMLVFGLSALIMVVFFYGIMEAKLWPHTKAFVIGLCIVGAVSCFIPDERQLALIIGGHFATNIEGIDKLPVNVVKAANSFLESVQEKEKK